MDQHKLESTIAVIGLAGRFPGADNIAKFWENLKQGIESVSFFSDEELLAAGVPAELIAKPNYIKAKAYLENVELFDANFFHFTPKEAMLTDPQHRLFLECAWEALEDAGYDPSRYPGDIGVYAGCGTAHYLQKHLLPTYTNFDPINDYQISIGNEKDFLCTRVSYKLNLTGPSVSVQTACSTSLVAINTACQALLDHQCSMALAGGVSVTLPKKAGYLYTEGMILSPDGHCRAFDAKSAGIVPGNGVGVVVLKRLQDAINDGDFIYALVTGTALNNDGSNKVGYTAPCAKAQASLINEALQLAEISADTIGYVEAHGTGTDLGDPIELSALSSVYRFGSFRKHYCAIGSVKTNIGHTDTAAGVAGFIKVVLGLHHKKLVPSLHFESPNPKLNFDDSPFYVNTELKDWPVQKPGILRRAAVNSFGIGGTNAHAILEEAPIRESSPTPRNYHLILLSARSKTALQAQKLRLLEYLTLNPEVDIADVAYTLQVGRQVFEHRSFFTCSSVQEAIERLQQPETHPYHHTQDTDGDAQVVFMFSGQGSQYANMSLDLYRHEPVFKRQIDRCARLLQNDLNFDIRELLYPEPEKQAWAELQLQRTEFAQPILFALELSIADVWRYWGIKPQAMIGHSLGEYVAAYLAGVLNLHEAIALVVKRGRLMQSIEPTGSMLAVTLSETDTKAMLPNGLDIAAINVHNQTVVSGPTDIINDFAEQLIKQEIQCQLLATSHAFHSSMMDTILPEFEQFLTQFRFFAPDTSYLCNTSGDWANPTIVMKTNYWVEHLRQPVRFADGLTKLFQTFDRLALIEVGPGQALTTFAKRHAENNTEFCLASLQQRNGKLPDIEFIQHTIGRLWMLDDKLFGWNRFYEGERRLRLPLPTYPFERSRYWVDAPLVSVLAAVKFEPQPESVQTTTINQVPNHDSTPNAIQTRLTKIWQQVLGLSSVGLQDNFFDVGGDSLMAVQLIKLINDEFNCNISSQSLLASPTIQQFYELITSDDNTEEQPNQQVLSPEVAACLVEIQAGQEDKIPLFLVHPVGGHVYIYRDLANCLGAEQPVYGLQSMALHNLEQAPRSIEDMAEIYLQAIRSKQPVGQPYYLAGASFGGVVAFEIAQKLKSQGESIKLLAMFDTPNVGEYAEKFELDDDTNILYYFAYLNRTAEELPENWEQFSIEQRLNYLKNKVSDTFKDDSSAKNVIDVVKINMQAMWHYKPKPYEDKIIFFRAKKRDRLIDPECPDCYWLDIAKGGIEVYYADGGHISMNYSPNIDKLKTVLNRFIL